MSSHASRISLADLAAAAVHLRPAEAAALARDVALLAATGELPGIPSAHVIRLSDDGGIHIEGPVAAGREVERAARLLDALLPGFDAPPERRVPGALRLIVARALGTLDLPPYASLREFADALTRFAVDDGRGTVRELVASWHAAVENGIAEAPSVADAGVVAVAMPVPTDPLTISDVRRARRATRLTLADISQRSRIPVSLLREFEWGYLSNWPSGLYGRSQVVRYARAAGLDEAVVVQAALPLLEDAQGVPSVEANAGADSPYTVPAEKKDTALAVVPVALALQPAREPLVRVQARSLATTEKPRVRRSAWAALLAIPALLAVGFIPAFLNSRDAVDEGAVTKRSEQAAAQPGAVTSPSAPPAAPTAAQPQQIEPAPPASPPAPPAPSTESVPPRAEAAIPAAADNASIVRAVTAPAPVLTNAAFSPSFATEGSAMFYHQGTGPGSSLMRADTDGGGAVLRVTRILNDKASNFHARPSPNGEMIAFDSDRDGERGIYVADAQGRNVRRVSGNGFAAVPSWSPDGERLAYVRAEAGKPLVWNLWVTNLQTGNESRLTAHKVGQPWGAAWFPNGDRIAYSHEDRLIIRTVDGSRENSFPSPIRGRMVRTPAVSPDGKQVIFQVFRKGAWLLDVATGTMRKVLDDPSAEEFTWSPDGRRVAYHSRRSGNWGVWIMAPRSRD